MAKSKTVATVAKRGRGGLVGGKREPRAATVTTNVAAIRKPTTYDDVRAIAKIVTPDTFADALTVANAGHGVTHGNRNRCRFTSRRITDIQNDTFVRNATEQLTDVQLLFVWAVCFPMATGRVFDVNRATDTDTMRRAIATGHGIINGARASFNRGAHGNDKPATESVRYGARKIAFNTPTA